jgi:hypothetical protein
MCRHGVAPAAGRGRQRIDAASNPDAKVLLPKRLAIELLPASRNGEAVDSTDRS